MKLSIDRTVASRRSTQDTFDYLLDFRNAEEWDAGTVSCVRLSGDGSEGTRYLNRSKFAGREVELQYVVTGVDRPGTSFQIVGSTGSTTSTDDIRVSPADGGSSVRYRATFEFPTAFAPLYPLLVLLLKRLGDKTADRLAEVLGRPA
ncbi:SRPBCC family protein [Cumulibacter manganitolerans]|uniref:SRPBCC family protein n=1 Tax=Cumulibacter manganitolerans TaxID=1884992 RepID=UPI0012954815|nr:SRPBCC family protein [Cumulibacter manganitolerans]